MIMKRLFLLTCFIVILTFGMLISNPARANGTILFSDNFDTDTSGNYDVFKVADSVTLDSQATFAYDYSADGISAAPSGTGTVGLKMEANNGDATAEAAAICLYPKSQTFSGRFDLKFDMWINYESLTATGATEFAVWGINCSGTKANADPTIVNATDTDGYFWAITGDGGAARDARSYEGAPGSAATDLQPPEPGFIDDADNTNFDDLYLNLFPSPPAEIPGVAGKQWVRVKMSFRNGTYSVYLDDTLVYQRTDDTYASGDIMLGYQDIFVSIATDTTKAFGIIDNLVVEEPPVPLEANSNWVLYE